MAAYEAALKTAPKAEPWLDKLSRHLYKDVVAYLDGAMTTADPIGTILGYITKKKCFMGYRADKYSVWDMDKHDEEGDNLKKQHRSLEEQVFKALGDAFGAVCAVGSGGVIPIMFPIAGFSEREDYKENKN
ncbi:hypothetical protein KY345_02885 [Candidatus Woesearchaeota archaeon]|nr:hypothetical protein [Candidatus Woesearchaeota archaeon]